VSGEFVGEEVRRVLVCGLDCMGSKVACEIKKTASSW
jgi:hypothetical protein